MGDAEFSTRVPLAIGNGPPTSETGTRAGDGGSFGQSGNTNAAGARPGGGGNFRQSGNTSHKPPGKPGASKRKREDPKSQKPLSKNAQMRELLFQHQHVIVTCAKWMQFLQPCPFSNEKMKNLQEKIQTPVTFEDLKSVFHMILSTLFGVKHNMAIPERKGLPSDSQLPMAWVFWTNPEGDIILKNCSNQRLAGIDLDKISIVPWQHFSTNPIGGLVVEVVHQGHLCYCTRNVTHNRT